MVIRMVKPRRTPHGQSAAERAAISNTANGLSVAQGFCWINLKGHIEKKCALSYLKVLSIGSSSRAQSWRFLEKFALPLSGRLLHDSVHQNSTVMIRKKKHVQTASGWYDIFRYGCGFLCLSTIFSVGSSQHCCSSAVISRRQFGCLIGINLRALHVHGQCNDLALLWVKISRGR